MLVFFQGEFVPETEARISIFDRSALYGDGLFETVRVVESRFLLWDAHLQRLIRGADLLRIALPFPPETLARAAQQLLELNGVRDSLLRIQLSRGIGPRGYSPGGADQPWMALSLHPAPEVDPASPERWRLIISSLVTANAVPLPAFKTCNKLLQVLARAEADARGADEALIADNAGAVVEGTSSNLFWIERGLVLTPPLSAPILPGTTRELVVQLCAKISIPVQEGFCSRATLLNADGIFLSMSSRGIVEVVSLDEQPVRSSPITIALYQAYQGWAHAVGCRRRADAS